MALLITANKNIRYKSDGKLGHLSTISNNDTSDFIPASYTFVCQNVSFRAQKASFAGSFALLLSVKKSAIKSHRLLAEVYGGAALSKTTYHKWFRCFKRNNFVVQDKEHAGRLKLVEDAELEALRNADPYQTQVEHAESLTIVESTISVRLEAVEMIQKQANWMPYELKSRNLAVSLV